MRGTGEVPEKKALNGRVVGVSDPTQGSGAAAQGGEQCLATPKERQQVTALAGSHS